MPSNAEIPATLKQPKTVMVRWKKCWEQCEPIFHASYSPECKVIFLYWSFPSWFSLLISELHSLENCITQTLMKMKLGIAVLKNVLCLSSNHPNALNCWHRKKMIMCIICRSQLNFTCVSVMLVGLVSVLWRDLLWIQRISTFRAATESVRQTS